MRCLSNVWEELELGCNSGPSLPRSMLPALGQLIAWSVGSPYTREQASVIMLHQATAGLIVLKGRWPCGFVREVTGLLFILSKRIPMTTYMAFLRKGCETPLLGVSANKAPAWPDTYPWG